VLSGTLTALALFTLLTWQALREYAQIVGLPAMYRNVLLVLGLAVGPLALWAADGFFSVLPLLLLIATLQPLLTQDVREGMKWLAFAALGFGYIPLLLGHLLLIH